MFEFIFLWLTYEQEHGESTYPLHNSVIEQLKYTVRGRENLFVNELSAVDLERFTRENSNDLCDFRKLFDEGQGVLLHLRDLGLTEDVVFGKRDRIQLSIQLLKSRDPTFKGDTFEFELYGKKVFHVALIRTNQLFRGNTVSSEFEFYNEAV